MGKILVLGANGFIGSHLVDALVQNGHSVRAFDRYPDSKKLFNESDKVEAFTGNFLNRNDLSNALRDIDYVFHFVSTTTPLTSENDPIIDIETNIKMSVELFQECVDKNIKKIVFPSSGGSIYGLTNSGKADEDTIPQPISPYAIGKLTIEHYLRYFAKKHGLHSVVYRISNPYGERQALNAKQGVIPIFLQRIANNEPLNVFGDGSMVRDFIYVKDVARMIANSFENANQTTYNLGSGEGVSINQLTEIMKQITGKDSIINYKETPSTFVKEIMLDTSRFVNEFGLKPDTKLQEGIKATWEYVKSISNGKH